MNLMIKIIFYTKGGCVIQEGLEYGKTNEEVTDAAFREEVEGIATQIKEQIGEGIITEGGKIFNFGNTVIRFSEIIGYQIFIEEIKTDNFNFFESEENEPYVYMNEREESEE